MQGQPMIIMGDDAQRVKDKDAQEHNISPRRARVADAVRSTLGPKGMDKMLVSSTGDVTVTNDGVTILQEMDIDNPTAEMIVEVAETQEDEAGDGTTTAVAIAGELLKNAEDLLEKDIHPTAIIKGYNLAAEQAREEVDNVAINVDPDDEDLMKSVAETSMTGKGAELDKDTLSGIIVRGDQGRSPSTPRTAKSSSTRRTSTSRPRPAAAPASPNSSRARPSTRTRSTRRCPAPSRTRTSSSSTRPSRSRRPTPTRTSTSRVPDQLQSFLDQEEKQLKEKVRQDRRHRRQRRVLPEGHRRHGPALPREGGHPRRPPHEEVRHRVPDERARRVRRHGPRRGREADVASGSVTRDAEDELFYVEGLTTTPTASPSSSVAPPSTSSTNSSAASPTPSTSPHRRSATVACFPAAAPSRSNSRTASATSPTPSPAASSSPSRRSPTPSSSSPRPRRERGPRLHRHARRPPLGPRVRRGAHRPERPLRATSRTPSRPASSSRLTPRSRPSRAPPRPRTSCSKSTTSSPRATSPPTRVTTRAAPAAWAAWAAAWAA